MNIQVYRSRQHSELETDLGIISISILIKPTEVNETIHSEKSYDQIKLF